MSNLHIRDEIARRQVELVREAIRNGEGAWGKPQLNLDVDAFRAYREGRQQELPEGLSNDPVDAVMMSGVEGKEVLCLA